jgi:RNA polymerase sigma-70 factor (ECF subfamily)
MALNRVAPPNVDPLEVQLVERAAAGDRDARSELFARHRDAAFRVALRITGSNQDALDVVQDGFIKAFERLADFERASGFGTWLLRIVTNQALDHLRRRKVRLAVSLDADEDGAPVARVAGDEDPPGERLEQREQADRLQRAIDDLPPEQRSAFALYASGDMTYGQIAEIVGVPVGTVMSRLYHARRRLREALADLAPRESQRSES